MNTRILPRVGIQQRVLPAYRVPFFDALSGECANGLSIFAGDPRKEESIDSGARPQSTEFYMGENFHFFRGVFYTCWQAGLMRWLREWQPEVLIMEANPRYLRSSMAMDWVKRRGGKVIGWGLGSPKPTGRLATTRMNYRRRFVNKFDALLTYSMQGADEFASLGFPKDRIFPAPNAVAPRPKHPLPKRSSSFSSGKPVVLFVGRLQPRKRVDSLIHACARLPMNLRPDLRVVGDGPQLNELKALAGEIYPDTLFCGALHGADLERQFRETDLFVLPGTGGLAVQQAMSFGLPVIVGVSDGTQVDLVRAENGWMLEEDSVHGLNERMTEALGDVHRLREMGTASYRIVSQEINLETMVNAFARAIRKVTVD